LYGTVPNLYQKEGGKMNQQNHFYKLKWGILGCAGIADQHMITAIQQSHSGEILAIASRTKDKAKFMAGKHGIPRYYGSYEELLSDTEIEAVYIPLPNHLHCEWVVRAAAAGKHILCEKPLALNETEAAEMTAACHGANVQLAEAYMYRHHPRYVRAREIIQSGQIGDIRGMVGQFTFDLSGRRGDIRFRSDMGGGSTYDDGCYPISAARLLLSAEPEAVTSHSMFSPEHDHVDMMNTALLEFPNGVGAMLQFGMWCAGRNEIQILGSKGSLLITNAFYYEPPAQTRLLINAEGESTEEKFESINHYVCQVEDYNQAILDHRPLPFGADDSIANMKVIEAVLRSSKERIRVQLDTV
jgi:xylose dehydrogenase (NAD/NADP)